MFIAALFTIAKTWKQPKCPSTDEGIENVWYMCIMENYSDTKLKKIMPFSRIWMDIEITKLCEVSQRQMAYDTAYMWNL